MPIIIHVPAVPIPQPRQRHRIVASSGHIYAHNYTPSRHPVNAFKASVQYAFAQAYSGSPLDGPLCVEIVCVFPRPKSKMRKRGSMPREPYVAKRADWDNVGKAISDALNGIAWHDDGQLVDVRVQRWMAAGDESAHVEIAIREWNRGDAV